MKAKFITFVRGLMNGTPPRFQSYLKSLTLLLAMVVSVNVWGQSTTYTSNVTFTAGTNGSTCQVKISNTSYNGMKLGTSSKTGTITFKIPQGTTNIHIHTAGWNNDGNSRTLNISTNKGKFSNNTTSTTIALTNDAGVSSNSPFTLSTPANASTSYYANLSISGVTEEATITCTTSSKRAVVWGVNTEAPSGYTIDFECNGATSGCPSQLTNQTNLPDPLPTTQQKTGYSFFKWYTNSGLTAIATAGAAITANTKLYAKWNIINRTITYNGDEQLNYTAKPTNATIEDDGVEVTYSVNTGYEITGVSVTMGGTPLTENTDFTWNQDDVTIMPESGITGNIVVTFTTQLVQSCTHEITITKGTPSNGSFDLSQIGTVCIDGGNATVSVTNISPVTHYHFKQITTTNGDVDNTNKQVTNISANTTINVEFEEDTKYTITFADKLHGESVSAESVYSGETFTFPVIADKTAATSGTCEQVHYHFMGWVLSTHEGTINAGDIKTGTSAAVTDAATYYAVWAKEEL